MFLYSGELIRLAATYTNKNVILVTKTNKETTAYTKCLLLIFFKKPKSSQEYIQENNESYLTFESAIINIIY